MTSQQQTPHQQASDQKPLSPHRHISFTAHYTGYIWYLLGISHPALTSSKGKHLATLLHPLETLAERFVGGSMRSTLKLRHRLIDRQLDRLIEKHPDLQVVEIAAGLSPRGWRYRQKHAGVDYLEADLPDMARIKQQALIELGQPQAKVLGVDLFSPEFAQSLQQLDSSKPLLIISEGLVNYFTKDSLQQLWQVIADALKQFPTGYYLTDLYPEPVKHRLAKLIWNSSKLLKVLSKSAFSFHFISPVEVTDFFKQSGFNSADVYQPKNDMHASESEHLGDLVWVIQAQV